MSKARMVILSVVLEGRSQADTARLYDVSPGWVSKLVARYRTEGDQAFEPRSRRPHHSPGRTPEATIDAIIELRHQLEVDGLDAGAHTISTLLERDHHISVSPSTVWRTLRAAGLVEPSPKKRPRSSYIRFEAALPNETWQSDMTHSRLADGTDVEILTFLDDHSRYALSVTAHPRVSTPIVVAEFTRTAANYGIPASVLTDNGLIYTTRFAGGRGGHNHFETHLARLGVTQKHSRPNHPTTCGKVERFQQTAKKWLAARPPATTIAELQTHLTAFTDHYNHQRPHRSLDRATPAAAYHRLPKDQPGATGTTGRYRIRHDHIDTYGKVTLRHNGRLHHIGIGRQHAHTRVVLLIDQLDIRIVEHQTGELLRHLTLDPTHNYQPTGKPRGRKRQNPRT